MNVFDIVLIVSLVGTVLLGVILGLNKGGRFFFTLCGAASLSVIITIPLLKIINQQQWFMDLSEQFLGYDRLNVTAFLILSRICSIAVFFILRLVLKFVGEILESGTFSSHIGGLSLAVMNGGLLLIATLLVLDFMDGKVDIASLENAYTSFFYTYLKPVLTFIKGGN